MYIEHFEIRALPFSDIRRSYEHYALETQNHLKNNPNDFYRVDKGDALKYFSIFPKWKTQVLSFCSQLKKNGEPFSYVDICGRASGKNLGASVSYLFSLKTGKITRAFAKHGDVFIDGDIFNPHDFDRLLSNIRTDGIKPAFITCMPMAGLQSYTPASLVGIPNYEAITYAILAHRLAVMVDFLRPGGFIMIERPFQFDGSLLEAFEGKKQNQYNLSVALKRLARKLKCRIEIQSELGGPYFLIHKPIH